MRWIATNDKWISGYTQVYLLVEEMVINAYFGIRSEIVRHEHYWDINMLKVIKLQNSTSISQKITIFLLKLQIMVELEKFI